MTLPECFTTAMAVITLASQVMLDKEIPPTEYADAVSVAGAVPTTVSPHTALENLEPFVDGVIGGLQESHKVAGVTVAVVYGGEIALTKGYGYADAARLVPVDPDTTLFRPGSISKAFTWTAVMQLVERGTLDLDTDVNEYLTQFQIPDAFGAPVTLRHILSHTAGFEDGGAGYLYADGVDDLQPMAEFLEERMPARVRAPGTYAAYSNWASALAALVVANQSGLDFDTYADKNIFEPLKMEYSTFREPVPDDIAAGQSENLTRRGGEFVDAGFEYIHNFAGAGSMSTTASDMARFMLAQLGDGSYEGGRILSPQMTKQMRQPLHRPHEAMHAMLHGFYEQTHNGRFAYGHAGSTVIFHSRMSLLPEEGVGVFISTNSPAGARIASAFEKAFFDEFFPPREPFPHPDAAQSDDASADVAKQVGDYLGAYRSTRRAYSDYQKIGAVFTGDRFITRAANGVILAGGSRYVEEREDVFVSVENADNKLIFGRDDGGSVNAMFLRSGAGATVTFEKIDYWDQARTHQRILGFGFLVSLGVFFGFILALPKWRQMTNGEKLSRILVFAASVAYLLAVGLLAAALSKGLGTAYRHGIDNLHVILTLCLVSALLALAALPALGLAWKRGYWSLFGRLRYTVAVIALLATAWSLHHWNLVGPWNA